MEWTHRDDGPGFVVVLRAFGFRVTLDVKLERETEEVPA